MVHRAAESASGRIFKELGKEPGCVFAGFVIVENRAYIFQVGNSVVARISRDRQKSFITSPQGVKGKSKGAKTDPQVTNFVAGDRVPPPGKIHVRIENIEGGDIIICMTDGFYDNLLPLPKTRSGRFGRLLELLEKGFYRITTILLTGVMIPPFTMGIITKIRSTITT